jgi:hypothetical protein
MAENKGITDRYVVDEIGRRHSECHGVSAHEWFKYVDKAMRLLGRPEWREERGILRIFDAQNRCSDPDCVRLNRRLNHEGAKIALYYLSISLEPIRPAYGTEKDAFLCYGHPFKSGSFLCRNCAVIGITKRLIQEAKDAIHKRGES